MAEQMKKYASVLQGELLDLSSEIALVSPTDTPLTTLLYAMGKTVGATDITVSWRERDLHKPESVLTNLMLEGAEAPESVHSTRVMKSNICQIMSKATSVSGTLNALNPHGIGNEFANEIADRLLELKLQAMEQESKMKELKANTMRVINDKQLDSEILDFVLSDNEETTIANIDKFEGLVERLANKRLEEKYKNANTTPSQSVGQATLSEYEKSRAAGDVRGMLLAKIQK